MRRGRSIVKSDRVVEDLTMLRSRRYSLTSDDRRSRGWVGAFSVGSFDAGAGGVGGGGAARCEATRRGWREPDRARRSEGEECGRTRRIAPTTRVKRKGLRGRRTCRRDERKSGECLVRPRGNCNALREHVDETRAAVAASERNDAFAGSHGARNVRIRLDRVTIQNVYT
jgi:hypothetical protein